MSVDHRRATATKAPKTPRPFPACRLVHLHRSTLTPPSDEAPLLSRLRCSCHEEYDKGMRRLWLQRIASRQAECCRVLHPCLCGQQWVGSASLICRRMVLQEYWRCGRIATKLMPIPMSSAMNHRTPSCLRVLLSASVPPPFPKRHMSPFESISDSEW
ncbi:hypothetical protein GY45DRAFT_1125230 [Cubamyces sp. BRFM 1775]|nr:hypothetical protein GY45DRAFT_1125230 [Cubamyces sp. BRFM 1775]